MFTRAMRNGANQNNRLHRGHTQASRTYELLFDSKAEMQLDLCRMPESPSHTSQRPTFYKFKREATAADNSH